MTTHTDLIARLREWALPDPHDEREVMNAPLLRRTADAIEALEQQVAALTKERDELEISNAFAHGEWRAVKDQLAAAQARESKLRDAMLSDSALAGRFHKLLALPTDDSALQERLKQERENCADAMWQAYLDGEESYSKLHDVIRSMT